MIAPATKVCTSCDVEKPVTAFSGRRRQCKRCRYAYQRRWLLSRGDDADRPVKRPGRSEVAQPVANVGDMDEATALLLAVKAFRANMGATKRDSGGLGRRPPGPSPESYVNALTADWKGRIRLLIRVLEAAKEV